MLIEIEADHIGKLSDTDLRTLIAQLAEREAAAHGFSPAGITWGGHQNAGDGGIDVRVSLPDGAITPSYIPRPRTGFQVKAQKLSLGAIQKEMAPRGSLRDSLTELARTNGAYVIVCSKESYSDTSLDLRKAAMRSALKALPLGHHLETDFYDARRIASWVNQHETLMYWVRQKLGLPVSGWRAFGDWSSSPAKPDAPYLLDDSIRLVGPSLSNSDGLNALQAIETLRATLSRPGGIVRLVGLSGVGKTRLVQALFDSGVGTNPLLPSDALYTDISDEPEPQPQEMMARLISLNRRATMIVDNSGLQLHKRLADMLSKSACPASLITIEYDINDDDIPDTDVFRLEPASQQIIEKMLELHFPKMPPPTRQKISEFSEGNARIAFALAATAKHGESLESLRDSDLFERIFFQNKVQSAELLDAAKVCSLLYSFDGEEISGKDAELPKLAALIGQTTDQLHKNVAALRRRLLVQRRGKWRAVLPHALANRLAMRALEDIPLMRLEKGLVSDATPRMLKSFSRRLGYLHNDEQAVALVNRWFEPTGLLADIRALTPLLLNVFENIAPVRPSATLDHIERAAERDATWFDNPENPLRDLLVGVLRSLAYDPNLFARSVALLSRLAISNNTKQENSALRSLKSLFWLFLSGTHATAQQRCAVARSFLSSANNLEQDLGLDLLGELLTTSHFTAPHSFDFGAWKRDYGFHPRSRAQLDDWLNSALTLCRDFCVSGSAISRPARRVFATHLTQLLDAGCLDSVSDLAIYVSDNKGWPEGWIAVRRYLRLREKKHSDPDLAKLEALEKALRPHDLPGLIGAYALSPEWGVLDIADVTGNDIHAAAQEAHEVCLDLGRRLAEEPEQLDNVLPELLSVSSGRVYSLGRGIAERCDSIGAHWKTIRQGYLNRPVGKRTPQLLGGFLQGASVRSPTETDRILDEALADPTLSSLFVFLQVSAGLNDRALERLQAGASNDLVPADAFMQLAYAGNHKALDDPAFSTLVKALTLRADGSYAVAELLAMRVHACNADKVPISEGIKAIIQQFLASVHITRGARIDHYLGLLIGEAFSSPRDEPAAIAFCNNLARALSQWDVHAYDLQETIAAIVKASPVAALDVFLEAQAHGTSWFRSPFLDMADGEASSLNAAPIETLAHWASQKPETRFELLAKVVRLSIASSSDQGSRWSPEAMMLIDLAPEPIKVLEAFYPRLFPHGYSGSLADAIEKRAPLLDLLAAHPQPHVASWATTKVPEFAEHIRLQRAEEARLSRSQDVSFE